MATRDYPADGITVHWDSDLCIHSRVCASTLPTVFRPGERPWVTPDAVAVDELAAAIDACPSRALRYTRTSGEAARGRESNDDAEAEAPAVTVTPTPNGPLEVLGQITVMRADGTVLRETKRSYLCRCGHSANKPFCDGSHSREHFVDDGLGAAPGS
jgi:uncharacterized Fe-S cluster protein YjdI/CDGSH-type Zn-finger protein